MTDSINFLALRRAAFTVSAVLVVAGMGWMIAQGGPNLGIDFKGGVHIVVKFAQPVTVAEANATLTGAGIPSGKVVRGQNNELLIDAVVHEPGIGQKIVQTFRNQYAVEDAAITEVGANVGQDLQRAGLIMVTLSLGLLLIYISLRFQWRFAVGAVAALVHDVLITLGIFSVLKLEINLPTLAAFLTVVGYSVNDTIIVFDRIRENQRLLRGMKLEDLMNASITQMLTRTLLTSMTTLFVVLLIFGASGPGELRTFSLALIFGIVVGTYSSIYIASALVLLLRPKAAPAD
ncbi:MAG: protein translocase subunit SecF [Candidatus Poribacteria bacterium]|nr:protein translocase subunit SecF [Candidatus Poribacteria bacterium]